MGACGVAAVVVLLLASTLLPCPASGEGDKPSSGQGAPAPTVPPAGGESGAESTGHHEPLPPATSPPKGKDGGEARSSSASPPPPPPSPQEQKASPPPGGPGPNAGTDREDTGSQGKDEETDRLKEAMGKCDALDKCHVNEFSACLQVSSDASVGPFIIVKNEGQNAIDINIKDPSNIYIDKKPLHLPKDAFEQMNLTHISPDVENITLNDGKGDCLIHVRQSVKRQSVSNWQQQLQQIATAMRLNPIYGASFFVFTVVLVGIVCACCKFAKRRGNDGVPYQQLEMGAQAPNSSGVDNTTSTTDGWEDGWDDDWDDEEAPARPSDKKPTSSVPANGLSLRSQTNSKDGWDVDWDD
ncbi:hypothetical protein U9M48_044313 [Paspalum notatum var. saurae]|uniref:DUF7356 domain-containing protein n=1 Tax=Paspalum notatum var. saurae TaxID=547442 RepID=A0AAQ3UV02_PASNO